MVECKFATFVRQFLDIGHRRIGTIEGLRAEAAAWAAARNGATGTIDWQMTTEDARIKLKQLYQSIKP